MRGRFRREGASNRIRQPSAETRPASFPPMKRPRPARGLGCGLRRRALGSLRAANFRENPQEVCFVLTGPKISGDFREFKADCNLGILYSSSLLFCIVCHILCSRFAVSCCSRLRCRRGRGRETPSRATTDIYSIMLYIVLYDSVLYNIVLCYVIVYYSI